MEHDDDLDGASNQPADEEEGELRKRLEASRSRAKRQSQEKMEGRTSEGMNAKIKKGTGRSRGKLDTWRIS